MRRAEAGIQVDKFYPPTDWLDNNSQQIDIRKNAENNSIVLLVGHSADFSKYSLLGLIVRVSSGTYDVYIDDVLVGSGVTSNAQYNIDFSTIATTYGTATTPEALVLHKVVIKPNTSGATITDFRCSRTIGTSGTQQQGVLWGHFELNNDIGLFACFANNSQHINLLAVTAKNDEINCSGETTSAFNSAYKLSFIPKLKKATKIIAIFFQSNLKRVRFENCNIAQANYICARCYNLEQISSKNFMFNSPTELNYSFVSNRKIKVLPNIKYEDITSMNDFLTEATNIFPTKLDVSSATGLTKIVTYGTSTYPMRGLRGLKVSNEAPFTGASPQIDVSYTGLDRDALVELFQSLPTVTGSQTLRCVGATGTANLTQEDKDIATNKGWGLTLS